MSLSSNYNKVRQQKLRASKAQGSFFFIQGHQEKIVLIPEQSTVHIAAEAEFKLTRWQSGIRLGCDLREARRKLASVAPNIPQ
jgi:hypothetical protein